MRESFAPPTPSATRLSRPQQVLLVLFFACIIGFGVLTTIRSAYSDRRHTDADVYFRAAWAARVGENVYRATDDNGWHFHYPPLLATLLIPLADPPHSTISSEHRLLVSYPIAIMIWYAISVGAIMAGVHILAKALEGTLLPQASLEANRFSRSWWALRILPVIVCLEPAGHSLGRGQVNPLVFLSIAGMTAGLMRKQNAVAGLSLATAICLKIFPAYLLLVPLLDRNWKFLSWAALGLFLGLLVVPGLITGFPQALSMLNEFFSVLVKELIDQEASIRSGELFNDAFGDLMSFKSILFKTSHLSLGSRPATVPTIFTVLHIAFSTLLTFISLWVAMPLFARNGGMKNSLMTPLLVGILITAVVPMVPTAQSHYFMLSIILSMTVLASLWQREAQKHILFWSLFFGSVVLFSAIREIRGFHIMTDLGAPVWSGMLLWLAGVVELHRIAPAGQPTNIWAARGLGRNDVADGLEKFIATWLTKTRK